MTKSPRGRDSEHRRVAFVSAIHARAIEVSIASLDEATSYQDTLWEFVENCKLSFWSHCEEALALIKSGGPVKLPVPALEEGCLGSSARNRPDTSSEFSKGYNLI